MFGKNSPERDFLTDLSYKHEAQRGLEAAEERRALATGRIHRWLTGLSVSRAEVKVMNAEAIMSEHPNPQRGVSSVG